MTKEEAIRRIKAWNLDSDDMEVLAVIIPELKESEDKRTRKEIINFLRSPLVNENITDEKVAPWIAWLEKQEWSEKDSLHLTNAILSAEKEWGTESCTAKWLKSLPERFNLSLKLTWSEEEGKILDSKDIKPQSHWKPSEEQIVAFRSYIENFEEKAEAAVGGWDNFDAMVQLYEQLKKLQSKSGKDDNG